MVRRGKKRHGVPAALVVLALPLFLASCAAPPAVMIASFAFDTAVFASTGKTPGAHVLSAVVQRDCGLSHLVTEGGLCGPATVIGGSLGDGRQEASADPYSIDLLALN